MAQLGYRASDGTFQITEDGIQINGYEVVAQCPEMILFLSITSPAMKETVRMKRYLTVSEVKVLVEKSSIHKWEPSKIITVTQKYFQERAERYRLERNE